MKKIFITVGDVNGIGSELILKFINSGLSRTENSYIIVGCRRIFDETARGLGLGTENIKNISGREIEGIGNGIFFYDIPMPELHLEFGKADSEAGRLSGLAIKKGVELSVKHSGALVTAPINKYSLHLGGFNYPGHTEFIAELLNTDDFLMILDGSIIRVALVTTHLALKDVPSALKQDSIFNKGNLLYKSLSRDYGIAEPRITVCSLNPHAGDSGLFGNEEADIISPAVERLNRGISRGKGWF
jgi:4-hydroxy-L-threonine phosphate dehydrogenase PdxA